MFESLLHQLHVFFCFLGNELTNLSKSIVPTIATTEVKTDNQVHIQYCHDCTRMFS